MSNSTPTDRLIASLRVILSRDNTPTVALEQVTAAVSNFEVEEVVAALREARSAAGYTPTGEIELTGLDEKWMSRAHIALSNYTARNHAK